MLTNNYYNYKKVMFLGADNGKYMWPAKPEFKSLDGSVVSASIWAQYSQYGDFGRSLPRAKCTTLPKNTTSSNDDCGVFFGTGATPATPDDYTLESPITSGLSITNPGNFTFEDDGAGKWTFWASYVVTNKSGAEINIREIGIVTLPGSAGSTFHPVLMERTVLTQPITIPSGGMKMITVTVTQNVG